MWGIGNRSKVFKRAQQVFAAGALSAIVLLTGCGEFFSPVTTTTGTGTSSYVYVTNTGGTLTAYSLTAGVLAALSGSPYSLTETPTSIVVAPNNAFLYVGTALGVFEFTIGSDGTLTANTTVVYLNAAGLQVQSMAMDSTSSWLILTYQNSTEIDALQIDPTTGLPTSGAAYTATLSSAATSPQVTMSPAGTNVFVALNTGGTEAIGFNAAATASPFGSAVTMNLHSANTSDTAVAVDPTSTYIFITEASTHVNSTTGLADTKGAVRMVAVADLGTDIADTPTGIGPSAVLADATGAYVYVTNNTDGTITGYTLSTTVSPATLTALGTTPTEASPLGIVEDSSKTYVMTTGNGANPNLWLYSFDATSAGTLDVGTTTSTASTNPALANAIAVTH